MKKAYLLSLAVIAFTFYTGSFLHAQGGIAINTGGVSVDSTTLSGLGTKNWGLVPRLTTAQRNSITPAAGLAIFNTDSGVYNYNAGTPAAPNWIAVDSSSRVPLHSEWELYKL